MRFLLDNDVAVTVRRVLLDAGHECWTAGEANLHDAPDDALAVYAANRGAVLVSHDAEFARRRRRNTIGQHVWLRCTSRRLPRFSASRRMAVADDGDVGDRQLRVGRQDVLVGGPLLQERFDC